MRTMILCLALLMLTMPCLAQDNAVVERHSDYNMVVVHGLGADASIWDECIGPLRRGFNVWAFELPGHGRTQPVANASIDSFAELLAEFIEKEGIQNPALVGHGMGGLIAMRYAFDHPELIHRLILIDSAPKQLATDEQKAAIAEQLMGNYEHFVANYYLNMSPREEVNQLAVGMALRTDQITFQQLLMSSFDFDVTDKLTVQAVPIMLIGSGMMFPDPSVARETMNMMGFDKARFISFKTMPHLGHYMMMEQPSYVASIITAFCGFQE